MQNIKWSCLPLKYILYSCCWNFNISIWETDFMLITCIKLYHDVKDKTWDWGHDHTFSLQSILTYIVSTPCIFRKKQISLGYHIYEQNSCRGYMTISAPYLKSTIRNAVNLERKSLHLASLKLTAEVWHILPSYLSRTKWCLSIMYNTKRKDYVLQT